MYSTDSNVQKYILNIKSMVHTTYDNGSNVQNVNILFDIYHMYVYINSVMRESSFSNILK